MMDENNRELWTGENVPAGETPAADTPEVPETPCEMDAPIPAEETEIWYELPEDEPEDEPEEEPEEEPVKSKFDELYVSVPRQTVDTWQKAAVREKKRRRLTRWIIVICLLAVVGTVTAALWPTLFPRSGKNDGQTPEDGDSASSIVDISGHREPAVFRSVCRFRSSPSPLSRRQTTLKGCFRRDLPEDPWRSGCVWMKETTSLSCTGLDGSAWERSA